MELMRLVVTGPVGAGKSTFIRSASEIPVVDTDRNASDKTQPFKKKTTVALDFGRLQFNVEMAVHLYGTPGQERFDFMWELLIRRAHAYILLVAANQPQQFRAARQIMSYVGQRIDLPMIVGLTHTDCPGAWTQEHIAIALGFFNNRYRPPIVTVNPHESTSVVRALMILVEHMYPVLSCPEQQQALSG